MRTALIVAVCLLLVVCAILVWPARIGLRDLGHSKPLSQLREDLKEGIPAYPGTTIVRTTAHEEDIESYRNDAGRTRHRLVWMKVLVLDMTDLDMVSHYDVKRFYAEVLARFGLNYEQRGGTMSGGYWASPDGCLILETAETVGQGKRREDGERKLLRVGFFVFESGFTDNGRQHVPDPPLPPALIASFPLTVPGTQTVGPIELTYDMSPVQFGFEVTDPTADYVSLDCSVKFRREGGGSGWREMSSSSMGGRRRQGGPLKSMLGDPFYIRENGRFTITCEMKKCDPPSNVQFVIYGRQKSPGAE